MAKATQEATIINERGLHARASAKFVGAVAELPESEAITVEKQGSKAGGDSILGLMMLGAAKGDTITIAVEGEQADASLAILIELVESGFGEL